MSQSTELMIDINVQDGASPKFKAIGQAAQNMGVQAEQAGGRAGGAFRRLQDAAKQNAMAIGLLTGSFGLFARAARDADRDLATLDRTYGDTADSLRDFGDELQRTTTFSNEQAVAAANVFGTLSRNYGLTADQIQNLIQVSADLAAVNGISLTDAAERVQAAIRGEAESAEALGLTMNETAIGLADVSAGMSEAEKAAYRYDALLKQAAFSTGAAAEQADTTAGKFTQLTNSIQDAGQDFVRFTGPLGQAVAGLSDASLEVGMAASGFAALAPVLKTIGTAFKGLAVSMGPVGLALAATSAAFAILAWMDSANDAEDIAKSTADSIDNLTESLEKLALSSSTPIAQVPLLQSINEQAELLPQTAQNIVDTEQALGDFIAETQSADYVTNQLFENIEEGTTTVKGALLQSLVSQESWNAAIENGSVTAKEFNDLLEEAKGNLESMGASTDGVESALATLAEIQSNWNNEGVDTEFVMTRVNDALANFNDVTSDAYGNVSLLNERLIAINNSTVNLEVNTRKANETVLKIGQTMTDAWTSAMDPLRNTYDQLEAIFSSFAPGAYEAQQSINGTTGAAEELGRAMAEANGDPRAREGAILQFYATASAMEILNYELAQAGDNQEAINEAYRMFAIRVAAAATALRTMPRPSLGADLAIADQQRQFAESGAAAAEYTRELYAGDIAIAEYRAGVAALNDPLAAQQRQMEANGRAAADYGAGMDEATQATVEAEQAILAAAIELAGLNDSLTLLTTIGAGLGMERVGDDMVNVMTAAQGAALAINALADGFQVLVQNPVAWGREAQAVADWATSVMLGVDGVNSLSDLWGRGQIETITYNRGIEAQNRILDANADIQNDVARIQAKQLPIMADLIEQQAEYIDGIADLDPKNQVAALGFMDVGKAAQAQSLMMLAAEGAAAGYGSGLAQMSEQIIVAAAQADPVLKAMLEDMGLIREGAEGEIVVNFARAGGLNNDIQRLIASIDALTIALGGIPPYTEAVVDVRYNVNGRPALPGEMGFSQFATGGTVTHRVASATPMFATAATGRTTLVGEAGPELVTLPTGSQVTSSPATMDRLRSRPMQGSGGGIYFYGPVTLQPASTDVESAIRREALSGSRGY